ncbi:MAG: tRNA preQ1(34) S-adenosylmethionine ribosyltransferase-isomerase QueA [Legionella sp.]|nr:tRNA preQ1(34) S-adenosylmethionine ribosyltransferase-isomerase QueA [Legionella sp.]
MKTLDFHFDLPEALIAQYPLPNRSDSRLLVHDPQQGNRHQQFKELPSFLNPGDLLVMNNSKVIPARLYGTKATGGKVELLVERLQGERRFLAHIKASKSPKPGTIIYLNAQKEHTKSASEIAGGQYVLQVIEKINNLYLCETQSDTLETLQKIGHIPLPPYIQRKADNTDQDRYQTVYAKHNGSVAAPTAGLHFDDALLSALKDKGVNIAYTTLHVGAGTFQPIRSECISEHRMHEERYVITPELAEAAKYARAQKKRIIAVGTTALRSLESAAEEDGSLRVGEGATEIFISPGYRFRLIDGLITNFHLPQSTLIILVAALIGYEQAMALYQEAISQEYRFFSYGDGSLLFRL